MTRFVALGIALGLYLTHPLWIEDLHGWWSPPDFVDDYQ